VIADQSGSGKTLAYLCPIVQNLRKEEVQGLHKSSPRNPRVIILTPTAVLASQVCLLFNAFHFFLILKDLELPIEPPVLISGP